MPIALAALQLQDMASPRFGATARRSAEAESEGSFGRLLDAASADAPTLHPAPQTKAAPPSDARSAADQGNAKTRPDAANDKPQPEPEDAESSADGSETETASPAQATPAATPSSEPEPSSAPGDVRPANEEKARAKAPSQTPTPVLTVVPATPSPVQAPVEPQPGEAQTPPQTAVPVAAQQGMMRPQAAQLEEEPETMPEQPEPAPANVPVPAAADAASQAAAPRDTFAEELEHILKKLGPEPDPDQSSQTPAPSPAMNPALAGLGNDRITQPPLSQPASQGQAPAPAESFAQANQGSIINGIRTQLIPAGGTMQIRLTPPELGAMQVRVEMRGETLAATFQTSTDQAAQLLTHSLGQLKHALEQQGVSVGRLQVVHTPENDGARTGEDSGQSATAWQGYQQQQNDQRREVLRQLWNRAAFGRDPIDYIA
jgi:flagellar hook-length control protein FliK